ncbi:glycosyltransferase family 2 protein [Olivibacter domesticus]|uniref:Glycosyltransferase involved in cell wall bisynthesis n=1 Tax=Olivibacter domesticus TaxID=407022 RepID=A0A1H7V083_OLID1|nr:glycosyltransferase family 2 protein [Olivibacter domesticus]SEM02631.1 Glycosyltransferase involved in cell wall bisynthesis [Olivibacter domesticus]
MKDNPRYTIAIPAFKAAYLKACIDSVLAQTVNNYELVIVNDCSPDAIDTLISTYSDNRIRYYKNETNAGAEHMVDNWNRCLALANGDYFVLLGDDDLLDHNYLESFDELIARYPTLDIYHCRSKIINEHDQLIGLTPSCPEVEGVYDNIFYRLKLMRDQYISDFVFRTSQLREIGGFFHLPLAWGTDDITSFIMCGKKGIAHTHKAVFNYRQFDGTISKSGAIDLKMKAVVEQGKWYQSFLQVIPDSPLERLVHQNILNSFNEFMRVKRLVILHNDLLKGSSLQRLWYWLKHAKNYQLSLFDVLRVFRSLRKKKN